MTILLLALYVSAVQATIQIDQRLPVESQTIIRKAVDEALSKLPSEFKKGLPAQVRVTSRNFPGPKEMPKELCSNDVLLEPFFYGRYKFINNTLTINQALLTELQKGKEKTTRISCQHKTLYDQAIATIIHELGHAYDEMKKVSANRDFHTMMNFRKGLIRRKNGNSDPMRSADVYETASPGEAFAVNLEYFAMDPQFACRKPSTFEFYRLHFGVDPFPDRKCKLNSSLILTTSIGAVPVKLDLGRVYRVDYLLAAPGRDISSRFGHSMYRLVICAPERNDLITGKKLAATPYGPKCTEDRLYHLVLSYRANPGNSALNYLKAMTGGYPSMLFVLNFSDVLVEYNKEQLRDVISYPINFTEEEKQAFLNRTLEEHWNYRGSYKFITNNCAVESLKLIKQQVRDRRQQDGIAPTIYPKITPVGLLNVLTRAGLLEPEDQAIESYSSNAGALALAYSQAYGENFDSDKQAKKALLNFAADSTPHERLTLFKKIQVATNAFTHERQSLRSLKLLLGKTASFAIIEQQIARLKVGELKRTFSEFSSDAGYVEKYPELGQLNSTVKSQLKMQDLLSGGYGVPLESELISTENLLKKVNSSLLTIEESQQLLKKIFPEEVKGLELINENIKFYNNFSLELRKEFRRLLQMYVKDSLAILAQGPEGKALLQRALEDRELKEVRKILDEELISQKEMSDTRLLQYITSFSKNAVKDKP